MDRKFRTTRAFLLQARRIGNERRWFCWAAWREERVPAPAPDDEIWMPVYWVDEDIRLVIARWLNEQFLLAEDRSWGERVWLVLFSKFVDLFIVRKELRDE